jgi:hypothetical protein
MNHIQKGFRPQHSIETCKEEVTQSLLRSKIAKKDVFALFVDMKNAYDKVNREILIRELLKRKILSSKMLDMVRFLFENSSVSFGRTLSKMSTGVPQGFTSSPLLFDIYTLDLI